MTDRLLPLPFSQLPANPDLKDVLDAHRKNIFMGLNCHHIGTIQSFDETLQTARVTLNYQKTFYNVGADGRYAQELVDYPILADCPVIALGGGTTSLTFPIQAGDECLVLFNDRDIDNWFQGGTGGGVATPRLHSFSDGLVLVGIRSLSQVLENYDTTRATLNNGSTLVGVGESQVLIANDQYTLNGLLQELVNDLKNLVSNVQNLVTATAAITVTGVTPGGGVSGVPANAAAITAVAALLTTTNNELIATANKIAGLLE